MIACAFVLIDQVAPCSQLYAEAHPDAAPEAPSAVSQPWEQPEGPSEQSWQHGQRVQQQFREQHIEELRMQVASLQQSVQTRDQDVSRLRYPAELANTLLCRVG